MGLDFGDGGGAGSRSRSFGRCLRHSLGQRSSGTGAILDRSVQGGELCMRQQSNASHQSQEVLVRHDHLSASCIATDHAPTSRPNSAYKIAPNFACSSCRGCFFEALSVGFVCAPIRDAPGELHQLPPEIIKDSELICSCRLECGSIATIHVRRGKRLPISLLPRLVHELDHQRFRVRVASCARSTSRRSGSFHRLSALRSAASNDDESGP